MLRIVRLICLVFTLVIITITQGLSQFISLSRTAAEDVVESISGRADLKPAERYQLAEASYVLSDFETVRQQTRFILSADKSPVKSKAYFLQGLMHIDEGAYDLAIISLKQYLALEPLSPYKEEVLRLIRQSDFARSIQPSSFAVKSVDGINTPDDEWRPVWSDNQWDVFYYTYTSDRDRKVMQARWISEDLLSSGAMEIPNLDYVAGVIGDGSYLYAMETSEDVLRMDTSGQKEYLTGLPFNVDAGDCCVQVAHPDIVFFASKRPSGYGGYDLYATVYRNGRWLPAKKSGRANK